MSSSACATSSARAPFMSIALGFWSATRPTMRFICAASRNAIIIRSCCGAAAKPTCARLASSSPAKTISTAPQPGSARRNLPTAFPDVPHQGRTLRTADIFGTPLDLYAQMDQSPSMLQKYATYQGARIQRIDHLNCFTPDVQASYDFLPRMRRWASGSPNIPRIPALDHRDGHRRAVGGHDVRASVNGTRPATGEARATSAALLAPHADVRPQQVPLLPALEQPPQPEVPERRDGDVDPLRGNLRPDALRRPPAVEEGLDRDRLTRRRMVGPRPVRAGGASPRPCAPATRWRRRRRETHRASGPTTRWSPATRNRMAWILVEEGRPRRQTQPAPGLRRLGEEFHGESKGGDVTHPSRQRGAETSAVNECQSGPPCTPISEAWAAQYRVTAAKAGACGTSR